MYIKETEGERRRDRDKEREMYTKETEGERPSGGEREKERFEVRGKVKEKQYGI